MTKVENFAQVIWDAHVTDGRDPLNFTGRAYRKLWITIGAKEGKNPETIGVWFARNKEGVMEAYAKLTTLSQQDEPRVDKIDNPEIVERAPPQEPDDNLDQKEHEEEPDVSLTPLTPDNLDQKVTPVSREDVRAMLDTLKKELLETMTTLTPPTTQAFPDYGQPPRRKRDGHKHLGEKLDVRGRADRVLVDMFTQDARENYDGNLSTCLDTIFWAYYGKPKLSYEE